MNVPLYIAILSEQSSEQTSSYDVVRKILNWINTDKSYKLVELSCYVDGNNLDIINNNTFIEEEVVYRELNTFTNECHKYDIVFVNGDSRNVCGIARQSTKLYSVSQRLIYLTNEDINKVGYGNRDNRDNRVISYTALSEPHQLDKTLRFWLPNLLTVDTNTYNVTIPKIIHLMWLSPNNDPPPAKYSGNIDRWKIYNPGYEVRIWNKENIEAFIRRYFPQYWDIYEKLNILISKCDFVRMCILAIFGGVYVDMDFYCRKSLNGILHNKDIMLAQELDEYGGRSKLFNGILAAVPNHSFIKGWVDHMAINIRKRSYTINVTDVMQMTGPTGFRTYYNTVVPNIPLTYNCLLFPYTNKHNISKSSKRDIDPYMYTLWTEGSGWGDSMSIMNEVSSTTIIVVAIIAFILLLCLGLYLLRG